MEATRRTRAALLVALCLLALTSAAAVSGGTGREQIRFNRADQAAARAALLRRSDLGPAAGWTGGVEKPDLTPGPTCANYHPKQSDLVLTGAARSAYRNGAVNIDSQVQVLRTRRMVNLDWRRSVLAPGTVSCGARHLAKGLGPGMRLVSFKRIPFPRVAQYSAAFRATVSVRALGRTVRIFVDSVLVGRSRSEITLTVGGPVAATSALVASERRLARILVTRARA